MARTRPTAEGLLGHGAAHRPERAHRWTPGLFVRLIRLHGVPPCWAEAVGRRCGLAVLQRGAPSHEMHPAELLSPLGLAKALHSPGRPRRREAGEDRRRRRRPVRRTEAGGASVECATAGPLAAAAARLARATAAGAAEPSAAQRRRLVAALEVPAP